ncbi:hypothetical protein COU74_03000 [Candidatus Peregrinibacteria bacterium CG10_big_fil_rev_8_21_14_0_10_36_19]|nr:MAG: hypothetical protein COU74_03000 [Candidatus Peregrinibacteria bacterium CG10_big_fil_rev_8_21_14_0_10_36_19]
MKKHLSFAIGLLFALPLSALAYVIAQPDFPDVPRTEWYADAVYSAREKGWISGYANGNFGPQNPVLRSELPAILDRYDKNMEKMYSQLKGIICYNKGNSLDELGLKVTNEEKYSDALSGFCGGQWPGPVGCFTPYDEQTGEYQTEFTACP